MSTALNPERFPTKLQAETVNGYISFQNLTWLLRVGLIINIFTHHQTRVKHIHRGWTVVDRGPGNPPLEQVFCNKNLATRRLENKAVDGEWDGEREQHLVRLVGNHLAS